MCMHSTADYHCVTGTCTCTCTCTCAYSKYMNAEVLGWVVWLTANTFILVTSTQWNLSITDTLGTKMKYFYCRGVLISEVNYMLHTVHTCTICTRKFSLQEIFCLFQQSRSSVVNCSVYSCSYISECQESLDVHVAISSLELYKRYTKEMLNSGGQCPSLLQTILYTILFICSEFWDLTLQ